MPKPKKVAKLTYNLFSDGTVSVDTTWTPELEPFHLGIMVAESCAAQFSELIMNSIVEYGNSNECPDVAESVIVAAMEVAEEIIKKRSEVSEVANALTQVVVPPTRAFEDLI
jgi:hypothetical protein